MTREEAKLEFFTLLENGIIDFKEKNIIDKIYDDFENKSCINCKHWCQEFQSIGICGKGIQEEKQWRETMTFHNFYCNKWEQK